MIKDTIIDYDALWEKVSKVARKAGRVVARPILLMYQVLKDKNTPRKEKMIIISAFNYLILPIDILDAKRLPIIGWADEFFSIYVAYQKVCDHITLEMRARVEETLDRWFLEYAEYEELPE